MVARSLEPATMYGPHLTYYAAKAPLESVYLHAFLGKQPSGRSAVASIAACIIGRTILA